MSDLETTTLDDFCSVDSGFAFKSELFSDDPNDVFLVKGSNLGHRVIHWDEGPWWDCAEYQKLSRYELLTGDIVLAMDRPIVGGELKFSWISELAPKALLVQRVARLRANNPEDQVFLRYVIASPAFLQYIDTITTGVNVPHISGPDIRKYQFTLPFFINRKKISAVLSAYDDLIENNLNRIKLLEEMAQITYEEWFVRMKFPEHETANVNPETGLPDGWKRTCISEVGKVITGKTPSTTQEENFGVDIPFIKTPDMYKAPYVIETNQYLSKKGAETQSNKYLPKNSLVISCIGSAGEYALVASPSQTNQQINAICFYDSIFSFYMYCYAKHLKPLLEALGSNGATMTNVNKSKFENIEVVVPSRDLLYLFDKLAKNYFDAMLNFQNQNKLLKEARDILLPRLMTGMIDIEKIELPAVLLARIQENSKQTDDELAPTNT